MQNKKKRLLVCLVLFILAAFLGGVATGYAGHNRIWNLVYRIRYVRHVTLEHDSVLKDGLDGILHDLDERLDLPAELYATAPSIAFDGDGEIQRLWISLYGKDSNGRDRKYTVSYDRSTSEKMEVNTDGIPETNYDEQDRLTILLRMAEAMDLEKLLVPGGEYTLVYNGVQSLNSISYDDLVYLPGDADGDGIQSGVTDLEVLKDGGYVTGFVASLTKDGKAASYIMEPQYTAPYRTATQEEADRSEQERLEEEAHQAEAVVIEKAKDAERWTASQITESVYYFLDDETGWRLVVTDAALGSRFYVLERTYDGGGSWERVNDDPFDGNIGVAEGLVFFGGDLGFAGLAGASQDHSQLYVTRDGGRTFKPVELPMDKVAELPESGQELGFSAADYDYCMMPEQSGTTLSILIVSANGEKDGITFQSEDQGLTWVVNR